MNEKPHGRLMWAKLNSYGVILAGLAILGVADLIKPGGADLARLVGEIPPGQPFWVAGYVISGLALLYGFARGDRLSESLGLALLFLSLLFHSFVAFLLLGFSDFVYTRLFLIGLIGFAGWARISVLWSKDGLIITIPPRKID